MSNIDAASEVAPKHKQPFFSIFLPTRNRPEYLLDAVRSVLEQTHDDFELIVSDNSDAEIAVKNQKLLESIRDSRCKYIRPPNQMSMVAHWEWGFGHLSGRYIGIVNDRMALRLYTLEEIRKIADRDRPAAVCYRDEGAREIASYRLIRKQNGAIPYKICSTTDQINDFSKCILRKDNPRLINSFVSSDIVDAIRSKYGSVFAGIAPDYQFMFRFLDEAESYISIDYPLLVVQGESRSNGRAFKIGKMNHDSTDFVTRMNTEQKKWLPFGPISMDVSVLTNVMLREYDIVAQSSKSGRFPNVDPKEFYVNSMKFAASLAKNGELSDVARETLEEYRRAHDFEPVELPKARRRILKIIKNQTAFARIAKYFEFIFYVAVFSFISRAGLSRYIGGKSLIRALRRDKARHFGLTNSS